MGPRKDKTKATEANYFLWKDKVIVVMPDMTVKTLKGPPGFDFARSVQQNDFCKLP